MSKKLYIFLILILFLVIGILCTSLLKRNKTRESINIDEKRSINFLIYPKENDNFDISVHCSNNELIEDDIKRIYLAKNSIKLDTNIKDFTLNNDYIKLRLDKMPSYFNNLVLELNNGEYIILNTGEYYLETLSDEFKTFSEKEKWKYIKGHTNIVDNKITETFTFKKGIDADIEVIFPNKMNELGYDMDYNLRTIEDKGEFITYELQLRINKDIFIQNKVNEIAFDMYCIYKDKINHKKGYLFKTHFPISDK